jgi:hypothetical protein
VDLTGKPTIPSTAADVGAVPTTRTVAGHALSADVTLAKADVGLGNVDNTADSAKTFTESQVTGLTTDLAAKAPLASPAFTGNPTAPTPTAGDNDTSIATTAFVTAAVAAGGGGGGGGLTYVAKTGTYTAAASDAIMCNASGGAFTITLPSSPSAGTQVLVKKTDTDETKFVTVGSTDSIDGFSSLALRKYGSFIHVLYTGSTWMIIGQSKLWVANCRLIPTISGGVSTVKINYTGANNYSQLTGWVLDFDDTGGLMWSSGSPNKIVAPWDGTYNVRFTAFPDGALADYTAIQVRRNRSGTVDTPLQNDLGNTSGDWRARSVQGPVVCKKNDELTFWMENRNTLTNADPNSQLTNMLVTYQG